MSDLTPTAAKKDQENEAPPKLRASGLRYPTTNPHWPSDRIEQLPAAPMKPRMLDADVGVAADRAVGAYSPDSREFVDLEISGDGAMATIVVHPACFVRGPDMVPAAVLARRPPQRIIVPTDLDDNLIPDAVPTGIVPCQRHRT